MQSIVSDNGITQYRYRPNGQIEQIRFPNGVTSDYRYTREGWVETITHSVGAGVNARFEYDYDNSGNRTRLEETNGGDTETTHYHYDSADRLVEVEYPDATTTYSYDAAFNRLSEHTTGADGTTVNRRYHYNAQHQLTRIDDNLDNENSILYDYDANGNRTRQTRGDTVTRFDYDARDTLREVEIDGEIAGEFLYDPRGLRIEKIGQRAVVRYTYDDQSVLLQSDAGGDLLAAYHYGVNQLLSLNHIDNGLSYYQTDSLGSVVNLTQEDGTLAVRYQYDAFGNKRNQIGESWNHQGFTGHEHDDETGLIYAKARYYDPQVGGFMSLDPWAGEFDRPPSLNKYLYAYANPTVWIDPDGKQATPLFHGYVNQNTDVFQTQGTIDTGNWAADVGLAAVYSVENFLRTGVNTGMLALNTPTFAYAAVTGKDFQNSEADLIAMSAAAHPAVGGGFRLATGQPFRALNKFKRAAPDPVSNRSTQALGNTFDDIPVLDQDVSALRNRPTSRTDQPVTIVKEADNSAGGVPNSAATAAQETARTTSARASYMGATPDKYSRTGREVLERMRGEGLIQGNGPLLRGNPNNLSLRNPDGSVVRIGSNVDMAHRVDAVTWWNDTGRFFGPKAPEVRQFMLSADNYVLQPSSINRSAGAKLGQTYQPPVAPDFSILKR